MAKLQAITKEQKDRIEEILGDTSIWLDDYGDGIHIDDWVSYDKLAELVDYLRFLNWRNFEQEIAKLEEYNRLLEENRKLFNACERLKKENATLKEKTKHLPRIATLNKRIHELKEKIKKYKEG